MRRFVGVSLAAMTLALAAIAAVAPTPLAGQPLAPSASTPIVGPEGDAFYQPPDPLPPGEPGDLIWYRGLDVMGPIEVYLVLYHSTAADGRDVAVSGSVFVPGGDAPPGGWPIESIGHPTTGIADCKAPSKLGFSGGAGHAGTMEVRTDYEGLGTPGEHAYLVGGALGANMLDVARAARQLPDVDAGNEVVLRGYSEGGHAALFAGELAESYAPDLDVVGVVAAAPAVELVELLKTSARTPSALHYAGFGAWGFAHAYGLAIEDVMTPAAIESLANHALCDPALSIPGISSFTAEEAFVGFPWEIPAWRARIDENTPGNRRSVPTWIFAGGKDPVVPLPAIEGYVDRACAQGTHVTLFVYPSGGHLGITDGELIDQWVDARRSGEPLGESSCDGSRPRPPPPGEDPEPNPPIVGAAKPAAPTPATPTFTG